MADITLIFEEQPISLALTTATPINLVLDGGATYTAGTGISIAGAVITNTAPNVVQELSIAGQDLTLSGGGGTVAIPAGGNGIYGGSGSVVGEVDVTVENVLAFKFASGNSALKFDNGETSTFFSSDDENSTMSIGNVGFIVSTPGNGIVYAADYSATIAANARSIPDVGTVENMMAANWPLLAPDGEAAAPSYSFENFTQTGLFMGGRGVVLQGGDSREITIVTEDHTDDVGDKITIQTGSSDTEPGGDLIINTGNSNSQNAGSININLGSGPVGGNLIVAAGNGTTLAGDVTFQGGTGVGCNGGSFYMVGGTTDTGIGGSINISGGVGVSDAQKGRIVFAGNGVVLPNVTTAQRNSFSVVAPGMTIYNTDATANDSSTGVMQVYNGSVWKNAW